MVLIPEGIHFLLQAFSISNFILLCMRLKCSFFPSLKIYNTLDFSHFLVLYLHLVVFNNINSFVYSCVIYLDQLELGRTVSFLLRNVLDLCLAWLCKFKLIPIWGLIMMIKHMLPKFKFNWGIVLDLKMLLSSFYLVHFCELSNMVLYLKVLLEWLEFMRFQPGPFHGGSCFLRN